MIIKNSHSVPAGKEALPLTFSGYASLFSLADLSGDTIERGAFSASLRRGGTVRMLWQHQADNPIGVWTKIREDHHGLYVEGQLTRGVVRADEAWQLISKGALDGLSIGFRTIRSKKMSGSGRRYILEADLWEISLVTFPMLPQARISVVQHKQDDASSTVHIIRQAAFRLHTNIHY